MFSTNNMPSTPSLEELICDKKIEFYSYGRKLETDLEDFGEYNSDLVNHIVLHSGNKMTITGKGLQNYLKEKQNLCILADFLVQVWCRGTYKAHDMAIHVHVDIKKFARYYQRPSEEKLVNGLGQVVGDATGWVPEMPYFEKLWNLALDQAIGGMVGYPGHEHPKTDEAFRYVIDQQAEWFMIGTPEQIKRYKKYALDILNNVADSAEELKKNPESIFDEYHKLRSLEMSARHARVIAENVIQFSNFSI